MGDRKFQQNADLLKEAGRVRASRAMERFGRDNDDAPLEEDDEVIGGDHVPSSGKVAVDGCCDRASFRFVGDC